MTPKPHSDLYERARQGRICALAHLAEVGGAGLSRTPSTKSLFLRRVAMLAH